MQNLKNIMNPKKIFYTMLLFVAYFLGESDLINLSLKKINLSKITDNLVVKQNIVDDKNYFVNYVVDGDTVHIKDEKGNEDIVRFLSVNTLEKDSTDAREKCLANMQTQFTKDNLQGKQVFLTYDSTQPQRDKYNRVLAYVATTSSSTKYFYNDYLMQTGNAKVFLASPKAKNYDLYLKYQNQAQEKKLGMWNLNLCNH
jgi:endonuclease YncB( thermonuclease family)